MLCALGQLPSIQQETLNSLSLSHKEWLTAAGSNDNSSGCILNLLMLTPPSEPKKHGTPKKRKKMFPYPVDCVCFFHASPHFTLVCGALRCVKSKSSSMKMRYPIPLFSPPACKNSVRSALRYTKKSHIRHSTGKAISLCNASLPWQSFTWQIKGCVSFISTAMLPLKASSQEMEEDVRGCAPSVIRYTVVALGYYSLIDSE